jgi:anti-sigma regulatory factor (Ser/Thr protein kinase)
MVSLFRGEHGAVQGARCEKNAADALPAQPGSWLKGWVVTLSRRSLALPAAPPSVRLARSWVCEVLVEIGRPELVSTAQLGVSELVTNAIIHGRPPLTVAVTGPVTHPRIEVTDHGTGALHPMNLAVAEDGVPATFGRGLALVAMNARLWGAEPTPDGFGKRVWFEPAEEMHEQADVTGLFRSFDDVEFEDPGAPSTDSVRIVLRNLPAQLFAQLRRYHLELRRELRLLALSDPGRYPIAVEATEMFALTDEERRSTSGVSRLDAAIGRGQLAVDLEYAVPASAPATMERALDLLQECYRTLADEHLLAVTPPEELQRLQSWYFSEFARQGRGEPARAWDGPVALDRSRERAGMDAAADPAC